MEDVKLGMMIWFILQTISYVEYVDIGGIDLLWFGQVGLLYVILRPTDPSHVFPQVGVGKEAVWVS